jgi:hypothetical protein
MLCTSRTSVAARLGGRLAAKAFWTGLFIVTGLAGVTPARSGELAPDLQQEIQAHPNSGKRVRIIARFNRAGGDGTALARALGGEVVDSQELADEVTLDLPEQAVGLLKRRADVEWVSPDRVVRTNGT